MATSIFYPLSRFLYRSLLFCFLLHLSFTLFSFPSHFPPLLIFPLSLPFHPLCSSTILPSLTTSSIPIYIYAFFPFFFCHSVISISSLLFPVLSMPFLPPSLPFCVRVISSAGWGSRLMCHAGDDCEASSIAALPASHSSQGSEG